MRPCDAFGAPDQALELYRVYLENMNLIKSITEITSERMNQCTDELGVKYLRSVRAIYGSTENGKPTHIGSCVAIEYNYQKYLITAAHVLDENEFTSLYVSGNSELVLIESEALTTNSPNGNRDNDTIDFAIIIISDQLSEKIGNIVYLTEDDLHLEETTEKHKYCLALGFPNSKNKLNPTLGNHVKETPFVYSSLLKFDDKLYIDTDTNPKYHLLLDFCKKYSKDENGNKVNSIYPKGVSGGGLFHIEGMSNPESYKPDTPCSGKFIGILIEFREKQKVLVYTKLSVIIHALNRVRADFSSALPTPPRHAGPHRAVHRKF